MPPAFKDAVDTVLARVQSGTNLSTDAHQALSRLIASVRTKIHRCIETTLCRESTTHAIHGRDIRMARRLLLPPNLQERIMETEEDGETTKVTESMRALSSAYLRERHAMVDDQASVALAHMLETLLAHVLALAASTARESKARTITARHVQLALLRDDELKHLFQDMQLVSAGVNPFIHHVLQKPKKKKNTRVASKHHHGGRNTCADDYKYGITSASLARIAYRAGVKRMSSMLYGEMRGVLFVYLEKLLRDAVVVMEHAERNCLECDDIDRALLHAPRRYVNVMRDSPPSLRETAAVVHTAKKRATATAKKGRTKKHSPGVRALENIRKHQESTETLLRPTSIFEALVRAIVAENRETVDDAPPHTVLGYRVLRYLQAIADAYLTELLRDANYCALQARRETVRPTDILLVRNMRREWVM